MLHISIRKYICEKLPATCVTTRIAAWPIVHDHGKHVHMWRNDSKEAEQRTAICTPLAGQVGAETEDNRPIATSDGAGLMYSATGGALDLGLLLTKGVSATAKYRFMPINPAKAPANVKDKVTMVNTCMHTVSLVG